MKILFAASEAVPYIKTGGLGDVAYALPTQLAKDKENEICVFLPYYQAIKQNPDFNIEFVTYFGIELAWRNLYCGIFKAESAQENLTYYFIDNEYYFNRSPIYGHFDDGEKFTYYSKAILEALSRIGFFPDVIHCNDWQTALIPLMLKANFSHIPEYQNIKTVFTIHNIEYQGKVSNEFLDDVLGLSEAWRETVTFSGCINFMKSAIVLADKITTVSKTYSYEIRHAYFAHGLENVLQQYGYKIEGIVNGIDMDLYDPQTDQAIVVNYGPGELEKKAENKKHLQTRLGLDVAPEVPIVAMITRLVAHKGLELVEFVADELMAQNLQFVIVGTGDKKFEDLFHALTFRYPGKVSANICFDAVLANQVYAGADMFLMPSKSEPCGLSQLISMRYGTLPIVRETGGLYDTVPALDVDTLEGRGFTFKLFNAHDMLGAVKRAIDFYSGDKAKLKTVVTQIMSYDCSWKEPVKKYVELYDGITSYQE